MDKESRRENSDDKKITTMKISLKTKARLDHLKINHRDSYEEVIKRMLSILNICRADPNAARNKLRALDNLKSSN